ncbi:MAG: hypothetical protein WC455_13070 [Dehalococcoidia bacterium]|jgi:hypothetical protein
MDIDNENNQLDIIDRARAAAAFAAARTGGIRVWPLVIGGVVVAGIVGGVVWYFTRSGVSDLVNYQISADIVDPIVPRGGLAQVDVTITNKSDKAQNPILRLDMWGTGIFETPIEGSPQAVGNIDPGDTVTVRIGYTLPATWGPGKKLNAQLMLIGVGDPVWSVSAGFAIQSDSGDTGILEIISVRAVNPSLVVGVDQSAQVEVVLKNNTNSSLLRTFRLDLKGVGKITWKDEDGLKWVSLPAGETTTFTLSRKVPTDWTERQSPIAIKIMNIGETTPFYGDVGGSDEFRIFTLFNQGLQLQNTENLLMTAKTPINGLLSYGQRFTVTMDVIYKGGGAFLFGAGLKDGSENGVWATAEYILPSATDLATVSVTMEGIFYSSLGSGRWIDMLKAVQELDGSLNIGGKNMIKADWDRDVFRVL